MSDWNEVFSIVAGQRAVDGAAVAVATAAALLTVTPVAPSTTTAAVLRSGDGPVIDRSADVTAGILPLAGTARAAGPAGARFAARAARRAVGTELRGQDRQLAGRVDRSPFAVAAVAGPTAVAAGPSVATPAGAATVTWVSLGTYALSCGTAITAITARRPETAGPAVATTTTAAAFGGVALEGCADDHQYPLAVDGAALAVATVASVSAGTTGPAIASVGPWAAVRPIAAGTAVSAIALPGAAVAPVATHAPLAAGPAFASRATGTAGGGIVLEGASGDRDFGA